MAAFAGEIPHSSRSQQNHSNNNPTSNSGNEVSGFIGQNLDEQSKPAGERSTITILWDNISHNIKSASELIIFTYTETEYITLLNIYK